MSSFEKENQLCASLAADLKVSRAECERWSGALVDARRAAEEEGRRRGAREEEMLAQREELQAAAAELSAANGALSAQARLLALIQTWDVAGQSTCSKMVSRDRNRAS